MILGWLLAAFQVLIQILTGSLGNLGNMLKAPKRNSERASLDLGILSHVQEAEGRSKNIRDLAFLSFIEK
jgi:hypothetical protein